MKIDNSITLTKGVGIILMVIGHSHCPQLLWNYIYMFHMPLFFIVSGYCFKDKYLQLPIEFFKRKINGIYKPFIIWSIIMVLLHNVFCYIHIYDRNYGFKGIGVDTYSYYQILINLFKNVFLMSTTEPIIGGFWFLRSFFLCSIYGYFCLSFHNKPKWNFVKIIILLVVAIYLEYTNIHISTVGFDRLTFMCVAFFIYGYFARTVNLRPFNIEGILFCLLAIAGGSVFCNGDLLNLKYTAIVPYYICAILGTWTFYSFFKRFRLPLFVQNLLLYIGNNTLIILALHFLCFKFVSFLYIIINGYDFTLLGCYPTIEEFAGVGAWPLYALVGILLPIILIYIYDYITKKTWKKNWLLLF